MLRQKVCLGARNRLKLVVPQNRLDFDILIQQTSDGPSGCEIGAIKHQSRLVSARAKNIGLNQTCEDIAI
jgi:hypothetical protein